MADDGPGIPEEVAPNLFKPFASARKSGGTGLGLSIVGNLVRAHGGTVEVEKEPPEGGAAFVVTLPRTRPPDLAFPNSTLGVVEPKRRAAAS